MKNATRLLVISLALMLSGCAYSPKQVEASRPLVNQTASTDLQAMAANLQQPLNTLPQGAALSANGNTYILGQRYVSALGLECIELLRNRNYNQSQPDFSYHSWFAMLFSAPGIWYRSWNRLPPVTCLPCNNFEEKCCEDNEFSAIECRPVTGLRLLRLFRRPHPARSPGIWDEHPGRQRRWPTAAWRRASDERPGKHLLHHRDFRTAKPPGHVIAGRV